VTVKLNHTIIYVRDKSLSADFYTSILGLPPATTFGPFAVVAVDNDVSLDLIDEVDDIHSQHYAFLISEDEFDGVLARIEERGLDYWADPGQRRLNEINRNDGGRGVYWEDPDGHLLEVITRPYGSGS
jgi:catechol 2,3-dioxygenase-like lactoylglutathione lyase family enzyme